jgi:hypothetical protein
MYQQEVICVENDFSRQLTIAILRRCDLTLLATCQILAVGCAQNIAVAVQMLRNQGRRAIGLYDGDIEACAVKVLTAFSCDASEFSSLADFLEATLADRRSVCEMEPQSLHHGLRN